MATQQVIPEESNQLQGLVDSFSKLAPLFGSGTKTETSTTAPSSGANANADQLLAQLQAGVDPKALDDLQNQIFDQARQKIAPELLNSVGAGNRAYSDTTLQDFAQRATGYATAASAQAKLEAITKNNSLMTQIVDSQLKASKIQTSTTSTAASPAGKGLQIAGVALGGYSAAKKVYDAATGKKKQGTTPPTSNPFSTGGNDITTEVGSQGSTIGGSTITTGNVEGGFDASSGASGALSQSAGISDFGGSSDFLTEAASRAGEASIQLFDGGSPGADGGGAGGGEATTGDGSVTAGDTLSASDSSGTVSNPDFAEENLLDFSGSSSDLGDVAYDTGANLIDNFSGVGVDNAYDVGENLISSFGGADLGGELAVNAGLDFGVPYLAAANIAGHVLGINEITEPLDALNGAIGGITDALGDGIGDALGGIGEGIGNVVESVGGSSIVCYELVRTGGMTKEHADISSAYAKKLNPSVVKGYHHMCPWLLAMMHKHKWAYKVLQKCAIARSLELESSNLFGKLVRAIFEPICWMVGVTVAKDAPLQLNIQKFLKDNAILYDLPKDS